MTDSYDDDIDAQEQREFDPFDCDCEACVREQIFRLQNRAQEHP